MKMKSSLLENAKQPVEQRLTQNSSKTLIWARYTLNITRESYETAL